MSVGAQTSRLAVLVFTDVVGSSELKNRLGVLTYAKLLARHDAIFRELLAEFPSAEVLQDTGDGFFAAFQTVGDAVRFALRFQDAMHREPWGTSEPFQTRVGIHLGELAHVAGLAGGPQKVVGIAADLTHRVMSLACGGQILLTRPAFDEARQFVSEYPSVNGHPPRPLRWMAHGDYLFHGAAEPVQVFEVGGDGIAPLSPPRDREKARRQRSDENKAEILGWRPAIGLAVPQAPAWVLEKKLGEGTFGEVWLAHQATMRQKRVFKFCFDAQRLESFKRELTLFRLLRDALGDRPDIARLHDVCFDRPPFFLETEYAPAGNLIDWASSQGGLDRVPLETRLEIVAQVCDAVAAAHSVGVLHKDIKPSNILMHAGKNGAAPRPQLADFGIGLLTDKGQLAAHHITEAGFTSMEIPTDSSRGGTRIYMPPEALVGRPFTIQGDIYALGILLYQMAVGDLDRPLALGWERDVEDELVREDITVCVDGDPARRVQTASEIATRLRTLPQRRAKRESERLAASAALRRRRLVRVGELMAAACLLIATVSVIGFLREHGLREAVTGSEALARDREHSAQVKSIENYVLAGDGLTQSKRYESALDSYNQAWTLAESISEPTLPAMAGMLQALSESPPPLLNRFPEAETSRITRVRVAPDGKVLVAGDTARRAFVLDSVLQRRRASLSTRGWGNGIAFALDGTRCVIGAGSGGLTSWDTSDWQSPVGEDNKAPFIQSLATAPDGRTVVSVGPYAAADAPGKVYFWSVDPLKQLHSIAAPDRLNCATFSPNGSLLATGAVGGKIFLWDVASRTLTRALSGHANEVFAVAFTPDGQRLLSGSSDKTTRIWDVTTGSELLRLKGHRGQVRDVAVSPDGRIAATASSDETIKTWDLADGQELLTYSRHAQGATSVDFLPHGYGLVSGGNNGRIAVWPLKADAAPVLEHHTAAVTSVAFCPDGLTAISTSADRTVQHFDVATGRVLRKTSLARHPTMIAITPDGRSALIRETGGILEQLDLGNFSVQPIDTGELGMPNTLPRGPTSAGAPTTRGNDGGSPGFVTVSRTGVRAASAGESAELTVFPLPPGGGGFRKKADGRIVTACFTPDERLLLLAVERNLYLLDAESGQTVGERWSARGLITAATVSPDGSRYASCGHDYRVSVWDAKTHGNTFVSPAHLGPVWAITFFPDGRTLVSAGDDNVVRLWDVENGKEIHTLAGHDAPVRVLAVSPSGTVILSGDVSGRIRKWDLSEPVRYRDFARDVPNLPQLLDADPGNAQALLRLGEWYAFRGQDAWALECLDRARAAGATVSPLMLARVYWSLDRPADAAREFRAAIANREAPKPYLDLCLAAAIERQSSTRPSAHTSTHR